MIVARIFKVFERANEKISSVDRIPPNISIWGPELKAAVEDTLLLHGRIVRFNIPLIPKLYYPNIKNLINKTEKMGVQRREIEDYCHSIELE